MSYKFKQPKIEPITNRMYQTTEEYSYEWITKDIVNKIIIPAGFRYDGASVPRFLWTLTGIRPDGLHRGATLVHDYIYHNKGNIPVGSMMWKYVGDSDYTYRKIKAGRWSRKDCDKLWLKMAIHAGEPNAKLMYFFIKHLGWTYWYF